MMKKLKIVSIFVILILFISSISVLATDINMNLPTTNVTSNVDTTSNTNTIGTNSLNVTDNTLDNLEDDDLLDTSYQPTTTVTSTSSAQNDSLGFSNILNILLIVVGFVLILLGIAIIIRIH